MLDKFVRAGNPFPHEIRVGETTEAFFLRHCFQGVLDMDQVAPGFADADVSLGLAPGHPELRLVAYGTAPDVFTDGFTTGLRLCLDGDLVLLRGTKGHPAGHVYLEIVGIKILFFHNQWC